VTVSVEFFFFVFVRVLIARLVFWFTLLAVPPGMARPGAVAPKIFCSSLFYLPRAVYRGTRKERWVIFFLSGLVGR